MGHKITEASIWKTTIKDLGVKGNNIKGKHGNVRKKQHIYRVKWDVTMSTVQKISKDSKRRRL